MLDVSLASPMWPRVAQSLTPGSGPGQALALRARLTPEEGASALSPLAGRGARATGDVRIKVPPASVRDEPGLGHQLLVLLLVGREELHELLARPKIRHQSVALHVLL